MFLARDAHGDLHPGPPFGSQLRDNSSTAAALAAVPLRHLRCSLPALPGVLPVRVSPAIPGVDGPHEPCCDKRSLPGTDCVNGTGSFCLAQQAAALRRLANPLRSQFLQAGSQAAVRQAGLLTTTGGTIVQPPEAELHRSPCTGPNMPHSSRVYGYWLGGKTISKPTAKRPRR